MTLEELIERLQVLAESVPGDTGVVTINGARYVEIAGASFTDDDRVVIV